MVKALQLSLIVACLFLASCSTESTQTKLPAENPEKDGVDSTAKDKPMLTEAAGAPTTYVMPSEDQFKYLDSLKTESETFVKNLSGAEDLSYEAIDKASLAWIAEAEGDKINLEEAVYLLGVAGATLLNSEFGMSWRLFKDTKGIDMTLVHNDFKIHCFPFSRVHKALEAGTKVDFLTLKNDLQSQVDYANKDGKIGKRGEE